MGITNITNSPITEIKVVGKNQTAYVGPYPVQTDTINRIAARAAGPQSITILIDFYCFSSATQEQRAKEERKLVRRAEKLAAAMGKTLSPFIDYEIDGYTMTCQKVALAF